ncbi:TPA: hypothetical protein PIP17_004118 [Klebsiella aerogenes]|nr:hypothetical protein [Klebsiella aerogenes]
MQPPTAASTPACRTSFCCRVSRTTLSQWEPDLLFEVKARRLKLLRMKAGRSETEKKRLEAEMEQLLAGLIAIEPARAAVLCD